MVPDARRDFPAVSIVLRDAEVSFCKNESLFRSAGGTDPQPQRSTELCKKGLELDRDWVVLFCSSANWVSGTGRTGQSGLGLAVSWGSRWEDMQAVVREEESVYFPAPALLRGPPKPTRPRAPQGRPRRVATCSQPWIPLGRPRVKTRWGVSMP